MHSLVSEVFNRLLVSLLRAFKHWTILKFNISGFAIFFVTVVRKWCLVQRTWFEKTLVRAGIKSYAFFWHFNGRTTGLSLLIMQPNFKLIGLWTEHKSEINCSKYKYCLKFSKLRYLQSVSSFIFGMVYLIVIDKLYWCDCKFYSTMHKIFIHNLYFHPIIFAGLIL